MVQLPATWGGHSVAKQALMGIRGRFEQRFARGGSGVLMPESRRRRDGGGVGTQVARAIIYR